MKTFIILFAVLACTLAKETMVNLADKDPRVLQSLFKSFQHAEGRHYANAQEARMRLKNFRKFVGDMAKANDEDEGVEYGVTFFADLTEAEAQQYYGFGNSTAPAPEVDAPAPEAPAPEGLQYGSASHKHRYNSAKHQNTCGSCWAFTTVGMLEGWAHIKTGQKPLLSEQQVLDCSGSSNNCGGGWYYEALGYIKNNQHLASASQYRYENRKGSCRRTSYGNAMPFKITGVYKSRGDADMASRLNSGPLGVAMDFRNINFRGYWDGVWSNTNCNQWPNHAITLVGYTSSYWEIRNSWGTGWGNQGYFKITRRVQNVCQIASNAWFITTGSQQELEE
ncbi:hypothetical protein ACHWQZ_G004243 [Mnemiopsis leidyi]